MMAAMVPIEFCDATIGDWNSLEWSDPTPLWKFNGRIDELTIFGDAITNFSVIL